MDGVQLLIITDSVPLLIREPRPPEQLPQGHTPLSCPYLVHWKCLCLKAILLKVPVTAACGVHLGSTLTQLLLT